MRLIKLTPLLLILLCSCSKTTATKTLFAMDTVMNISIHSKDSANQVSEIEKMIFDIDKKLDRKSENSEIGALNKNGTDEISQDTLRLIDKSIQLYEETDGCFDITIAPLMDLWGFYEKDYHVPTDTEISSLVIGSDKIQISDNRVNLNGTQIDLGGIAKGHTSDVITDYLKAQGVQSAIISLGGNVYALGQKLNGEAWKVAITDPKNSSQIIGSVSVEDKAVITSGVYQRNFTQNGNVYHHIINPKTGKNPDNNLQSVTVIGADATECDALSTAFMVMGIDLATEYIKNHTDIDAVFIDADSNISITSGIAECFKSDRNFHVIDKALVTTE